MQNFNEAGLPQPLFHRLEQIGITVPTPVQVQAIPHALNGKDILASAQTGTGKTFAFGIPLVTRLLNNSRGTALILLPTRELAAQVLKELDKLIGSSKIRTALLIGGEDMRRQFRQLQANPRLIVGTPGRINDHLERGSLKLHDTDFLVLDEVDRMLDLGFGVQLDEIKRYLISPNRQTLMFSATLPANIQKLSAKYLTDPIRITIGSSRAPAENVEQENVRLQDSEKYPRLLEELEKREGSIIIFVKTKRGADNMSEKLRRKGHKTDALHGDLRQSRRNSVIDGFRKKKFRILIATDVAARGLDVPHIEHVINYDLPQCPEDYIHRVGRTARAGAKGYALNFVGQADGIKFRAIQRLLNPNEKLEDAPREQKRKPKRSFGGGSRNGNGNGYRGNRNENRRYDNSDNNEGGESGEGRHRGENRRSEGGERRFKDNGGQKRSGRPEGSGEDRRREGGGAGGGRRSPEGSRDGGERRRSEGSRAAEGGEKRRYNDDSRGGEKKNRDDRGDQKRSARPAEGGRGGENRSGQRRTSSEGGGEYKSFNGQRKRRPQGAQKRNTKQGVA